jgi:intein-encoded DNA endonuclease-like protein
MIPQITRKMICERYKEVSRVKQVASEFGVNEKTVRNILKQYRIPTTPRELRNKKYIFDMDYFKDIDSDSKAYMLGFVFGDGSVKEDKLSIEVSLKDECVLRSFQYLLGSKPPQIQQRTRKRNGTVTKSSTINVCGRQFVDHLKAFGLLGSKSTTIQYPSIKFDSGFIRGLSDSDGCIRIDKQNRVLWSLISSRHMCLSVCEKLKSFKIHSRILFTKYDGLDRLVITRKSDAIKLREFLYPNNNVVCLDRKQSIFSEIRYKKGGEG